MAFNTSSNFFASPSAAPGGTLGTGPGSAPNITQSNAFPNTPFLGGVSNVNVGTGTLGQFGGYIPTPLGQFNNYKDYLTAMPGAQQMNDFASIPIQGAGGPNNQSMPGKPSFYQYYVDPMNAFNGVSYGGLTSDLLASPYQNEAFAGAMQSEQSALGGHWGEVPNPNAGPQIVRYDPNTGQPLDANGQVVTNFQPQTIERFFQDPSQGFLYGPGGWTEQAAKFGKYGDTLAGMAPDVWSSAQNQANKLFGLEEPIINQAFDPQNALYARTAQQLTDQTRAGLEARGVDMSPYGAGVEAGALSNFNIDWQNSQLQRMAQGAQAVGGLAGEGSQILQGGAGVAGGLYQGAAALDQMKMDTQQRVSDYTAQVMAQPNETWNAILKGQQDELAQLGAYGQEAAAPFQKAFQNWQDIQNQFLAANQQSFNQNQISGFEDPFSMLQLQSQIEMEREQMNMQQKMQQDQQKQQKASQGAGAGASALGGMKGGI